ncbi:hypothetical protein IIE18_10760 [Pseudomonas sp. V1]|uniref:hypothetical protein n=1 Tax=Pseudomonas arcuscaelestis TaxID=2710591 RepID=UPI0019401301|nr:hypothetical protein [Pseudomonas arcuscaelestis]MBM3105621.1 hypothetical protein [Pseudomonas arcuscaelestis]
MAWQSVANPPATPNLDLLTPRSEPVQGLYSDGTQAVVRWYAPEDEDDESEGRWTTNCSECWDVTGRLTHWRDLFPSTANTVEAFVIDQDQFQALRSIMNGVYGDGRIVTADERRDLANRLSGILGTIQGQKVELDA